MEYENSFYALNSGLVPASSFSLLQHQEAYFRKVISSFDDDTTTDVGKALETLKTELPNTIAPLETKTASALRHTAPRRATIPGLTGLPTVLAPSPTVATGLAGAVSGITGSVLRSTIKNRECFTVYGCPGNPYAAVAGVGGIGIHNREMTSLGRPTGPWAVEFEADLTTGKFEVEWMPFAGPGGGVPVGFRVLVVGEGYVSSAVSATASTTAGDGSSTYKTLIDFGKAIQKTIRLELDSYTVLVGVHALPVDGIRAVSGRPGRRLFVVGDSYVQPTITESDATRVFEPNGFAFRLGYMLGIRDVWSVGLSSTGYVAKAGGTVANYQERLSAAVLPYLRAGDIVMFFGSLNDNTSLAATVTANARACFQAIRAAQPGAHVVAVGPQPTGGSSTIPPNFVTIADAVIEACAAENLPVLDLCRMPFPVLPKVLDNCILAAATAIGATTAIINRPNATAGMTMQFGIAGTNRDVRRITAVTGNGPFTVTLDAPLSYAHASGQSAITVGPAYVTGTGKLGAAVGDGNSDRYIGTDTTHITADGHVHLASIIAEHVAATLPV
jgi:lysophospholipase L1-like esterase